MLVAQGVIVALRKGHLKIADRKNPAASAHVSCLVRCHIAPALTDGNRHAGRAAMTIAAMKMTARPERLASRAPHPTLSAQARREGARDHAHKAGLLRCARSDEAQQH